MGGSRALNLMSPIKASGCIYVTVLAQGEHCENSFTDVYLHLYTVNTIQYTNAVSWGSKLQQQWKCLNVYPYPNYTLRYTFNIQRENHYLLFLL